ncbi:MAG: hypothetical protein ITF99_06335 [Chryseobacterium sp.]|nr:hypothetical protein [Chryseobacterium sp.]
MNFEYLYITKKINMGLKKKYKKEVLKSLKHLNSSEHKLLETMTQLMLLKEMKENGIVLQKGDTFSFDDDIFDYSPDKTVRKIAKLRRRIQKTMLDLVENNELKDEEIKFLA